MARDATKLALAEVSSYQWKAATVNCTNLQPRQLNWKLMREVGLSRKHSERKFSPLPSPCTEVHTKDMSVMSAEARVYELVLQPDSAVRCKA